MWNNISQHSLLLNLGTSSFSKSNKNTSFMTPQLPFTQVDSISSWRQQQLPSSLTQPQFPL
uniref:60S ribosomal protein L37, putative n=1 Tax=Arundo donax TaxID=35708 RepID=A0A0A9IAH3_ARUDO